MDEITGNEDIDIEELSLKDSAILQKAISTEDWARVGGMFSTLRGGLSIVTQNGDTLLHLALGVKDNNYVNDLIKRMDSSQLAIEDNYGNNSLIHAIRMGNMEATRWIYSKNPNLLDQPGSDGQKPLEKAVVYGQLEIAESLYSLCKKEMKIEDRLKVIGTSINFGCYGLVQLLLNDCQTLGVDTIVNILTVLARKPELFSDGLFQRLQSCVSSKSKRAATLPKEIANSLWQKFLERNKANGENKKKCPGIFFTAAESGNFEYLKLLLNDCPYLLHCKNEKHQNVFDMAIQKKRNTILNLLTPKFLKKHLLAFTENAQKKSILRCAAECKGIDGELSNPAIELVHDLLLFKEIENLVNGKTDFTSSRHRQTFMTTHRDTFQKAQKWIVDTCNSALIVAAMKTTILFSGIYFGFSTGQGNRQDKLVHYFVGAHRFFTLMSCLSVITFFSLLTSQCTFKDFILWIPMKLFLGFFFLLVSGSYILWALAFAFVPIPWIIPTAIASCIPYWLLYTGLLKDLLCLLCRSVWLGRRRRW